MEWLMASVVTGDRQRTLWSAIQWVNVVPAHTGQLGGTGGCGGALTEQEAGGHCDEHRSPDHGAWMSMLGQRREMR